MIATRNKILIFLTVFVVCCIVYISTNSNKPFPEIPKIANVSYVNTEISSLSHKVKLKKRFPNAIIIGSAKSGTRALLEMLDSHPMIRCAPPEVNYFTFHFNKGLEWYINQMPETEKNELTIEKSPRYFVTSSSPKRIYKWSRHMQFILAVRNPIIRAVSHYVELMYKIPKDKRQEYPSFKNRILHPNGTIISTVDEINVSMYDVHYRRWLKWFDKKQILVLNGDELITNPVPILNKVESFLNVSHYFENRMFAINEKGFYCWKRNATTEELQCLGSSKGRPHPTVSNSTLNKLKQFLQPHAQKFCRLADVKFNWCSL